MYKKSDDIFMYIIGLLAPMSFVLFGFNLSPLDFVMVIYLLKLALEGRFKISKNMLLFFIGLLSYRLIVSLFYLPIIKAGYDLNIFGSIIKFIITFLYLWLGYNLKKDDYLIIGKGMLMTSVIVTILGAMMMGLGKTAGILFEYNRFRGLMNDPNYFSLVQFIVLIFLDTHKSLFTNKKFYILNLILIIGIMMSISKTSFIVLFLYFVYLTVKYVNTLKFKNYIFLGLVLLMTFGLIFILISKIDIIGIIMSSAFGRLLGIFSANSLSAGGSNRFTVWGESLEILTSTFLVGRGFSSNNTIVGINLYTTAHNTYLQLISDWGIGFGLLTLIVVYTKLKHEDSKFFKFSVMIIALYCLTLTLLNSRIVFLIIGTLMLNSKGDEDVKV